MRDLLFLVLTVGFFGLTTLFVVACDRIVGPDTAADDAVEGGHRELEVAAP
jgi:hypothetical protein